MAVLVTCKSEEDPIKNKALELRTRNGRNFWTLVKLLIKLPMKNSS